jgi:hypothetical protein
MTANCNVLIDLRRREVASEVSVPGMDEPSLKGLVPESWHCIDCGFDTAPGFLDQVAMERALEANHNGR